MSQNWEYKVMTLKNKSALLSFMGTPKDEEAAGLLNKSGARGWELVTVTQAHWGEPPKAYFKRPR